MARTSGSSCARSIICTWLAGPAVNFPAVVSRFPNRSKNSCRAGTAPRSWPILLCCASREEIAAAETRRHAIQRVAQTRPRPGLTLLSAQPDLDAIATVPPGGKIACADEICDSPLARATPRLAGQLTAGRSGSLIPRTGGSLSRRSASSWQRASDNGSRLRPAMLNGLTVPRGPRDAARRHPAQRPVRG